MTKLPFNSAEDLKEDLKLKPNKIALNKAGRMRIAAVFEGKSEFWRKPHSSTSYTC